MIKYLEGNDAVASERRTNARSYIGKNRMLRASVRCQFKCIRCEGVRGRSAAGPPSLSSTLLRYYTASIVHILHIHIIFYIYISIHIHGRTTVYMRSGRNESEKKNIRNIYIYIHIP